MVLCIHAKRLPYINTHGFANRIGTTLSTVNAMMAVRSTTHDLDEEMIRATHDTSISVMISFLCESGVLEGDSAELSDLKECMLNRLRHEKVPAGLSSVLSIIALLRHITCMVICGEMYTEMPTVTNMCVAAMHHVPSSALIKVNWRSWASLERSIRSGEVVRLTLLLEANLKVRALIPAECIRVILCNVVDEVSVVLNKMVCSDTKTVYEKGAHKCKKGQKQNEESFSRMASQMMIEIIVAGVMKMEKQNKAQYAYCVLCVNMLDLYGEQYMHWGRTPSLSIVKRAWATTIEVRIREKQNLMAKTIAEHGRQMVYEQVKKMVTNVCGLLLRLPEVIQCDYETETRIKTTLTHLCPEMTLRSMSTRTRLFQAHHTGINLLRNITILPEKDTFVSCLMQAPMRTSTDFMHVAGSVSHNEDKLPSFPMPENDFAQVEKKLCDVLENAHYVLSAKLASDDPRRKLILSLRRQTALTYLDMLYSIWANV